jgi:chromosome segregation ATPase
MHYSALQGERLARVEEQVNELRDKVDSMERKLDELLALRYKGAGAFWLAAALVGTGIIGAVAQLFHYLGIVK